MQKFTLLTVLVVLMACEAWSQSSMNVKQFNFTSFDTTKRFINENVEKRTSEKGKQHPEYGIRPYNTQCTNCVELIDKRTANTRLYINPYRPNYTYSQQSYFPLHFQKRSQLFQMRS